MTYARCEATQPSRSIRCRPRRMPRNRVRLTTFCNSFRAQFDFAPLIMDSQSALWRQHAPVRPPPLPQRDNDLFPLPSTAAAESAHREHQHPSVRNLPLYRARSIAARADVRIFRQCNQRLTGTATGNQIVKRGQTKPQPASGRHQQPSVIAFHQHMLTSPRRQRARELPVSSPRPRADGSVMINSILRPVASINTTVDCSTFTAVFSRRLQLPAHQYHDLWRRTCAHLRQKHDSHRFGFGSNTCHRSL